MKLLREIYDFITGGSRLTPLGLALALLAAFTLPVFRAEAFVAIVVATLVASTFEAVR